MSLRYASIVIFRASFFSTPCGVGLAVDGFELFDAHLAVNRRRFKLFGEFGVNPRI
ncbi:MAG: hypothetical protein ACSHYB_17025 [Roseibacillus sp.]